eukprot:1993010-Pyramimonas_sp.AAC.1
MCFVGRLRVGVLLVLERALCTTHPHARKDSNPRLDSSSRGASWRPLCPPTTVLRTCCGLH